MTYNWLNVRTTMTAQISGILVKVIFLGICSFRPFAKVLIS